EYLSRFAEKAARGYAHGEAVQALNDALQHIDRMPADVRDLQRLQTVLALADSMLPLGRINELLSLLPAEHDRVERLREPALAARYYFILARAYMLGNHRLVEESARRAITEAERCGDSATMGGAYAVLAVACALLGQSSTGIECGRRAIALLETSPEQWSLSYACWALGLCCAQTGAFEEAITAEHHALSIAQEIGNAALEVSAGWVIGITHAAMGDWDQGILECQRAVQAARDVLYRAISTGFLGFAYMEKGDSGAATAALEEAIPLVCQFGMKQFEGWFTAFLAETHRLEGRLDRAEALAGHACLIAAEANHGIGVGWAQQSLGRTAVARRDLAKAMARLEQALATFTTTHSRYECARTHVDLAAVCQARGDGEAAGRHLNEAYALFKALDVPRYRERVEQLAAEWGMALTSDSRS
ncbi:MAG: hypothetical protein C5B48_04025, partial [Candidatus Rokuibacteriota bacterium]